MSALKNNDVIKGVLGGDQVILTAFYRNNLPKITNFILKNSGNEADAEDVFQDALVLTYQKLRDDDLSLECALATYVFAVSRNLWMNTLRKRRKILLNDEFLGISEDLNESILETIFVKERQFLFQKYFLKLGERCQEVLLHFFSGKSMVEISKLMGYSEGYTRKKKFECKKHLTETIAKDPIFHEL